MGILIYSIPTYAEDTISLSKLLSINDSLKHQANSMKPMLKTLITEIHNDYVSNLDNPTENQLKELKKIYDSEEANVDEIFRSEEIGLMWESSISQDFSDRELIEISKFYGSAIGKRFVASMNKANNILTNELMRTYDSDLDKFAETYLNKLDKAMECCVN